MKNVLFKTLKSLGERYLRNDLGVEGMVFNIQKFSIHDGPGIRTTVFLKGCSLRCSWCSNPESINPYPEIITQFERLCRHCNRCLDVCSEHAISVTKQTKSGDSKVGKRLTRTLDRNRCNLCMECVQRCPTGALSSIGKILKVEDVMKIVEQDRPFYETSGGGITVSGGEPLFQPKFALSILRESKRRGLHTALDTNGNAPLEVIKALLPYTDLFLYDVKHMDPNAHRMSTGSDNRRILDNLKYINGKANIWLRVPLIPGFNDDDETIIGILRLAKRLDVEKITFLPFHKFGTGKYLGLSRTYSFSDVKDLSDEKLKTISRLSQSIRLSNFEIALD